ncbi:hypothetical protein BR93DRAFT_562296 [Coniochaeta sp. PMI_546]|nr:hypothetical protein BR93DRAFT_562296 [Coniochaeta sp. PMI_546]
MEIYRAQGRADLFTFRRPRFTSFSGCESRQTLALGGHVLQWSGIQRWMQVLLAQMRNPDITNEDMTSTAPKHVRVIAKLCLGQSGGGRSRRAWWRGCSCGISSYR